MNQELTQKLYDDFPELFRGKDKSMRETLMCFGFDCRDGWFRIIYELSSDIMKLSEQAGTEPPEVVQVKEKFGGLRYYVHGATQAIDSRIQEAEAQSLQTCEICCSSGRRRSGGWIQTLCDEHCERGGEHEEAVDTRH